MVLKIAKWACLVVLSGSILHCASQSYGKKDLMGLMSPPVDFTAVQFPEVMLQTADGGSHRGKMIRIQGESVVFAPSPYWNVDRAQIPIDDIRFIRLMAAKRGAVNGFHYGFGITASSVGLLGLFSSKYDKDYQGSMIAVPIAGLVGGLIGLAFGGLNDAATRHEFDLSGLPHNTKKKILANIMGL